MHNNDDDSEAPGKTPGERPGKVQSDRATNPFAPEQPSSAPLDENNERVNIAADESSIEESLNHALNDLEHMLERHKGPAENSRDSRHEGLGHGHSDGHNDGHSQRIAAPDSADERGQKYVIPLLDEVVIPGLEGHAPQPAASLIDTLVNDDDEPALRKRLAERLASEIEVITQHRIEAALETAREEIRVQVRNHLDIMLPEIVEELNQLRRRR